MPSDHGLVPPTSSRFAPKAARNTPVTSTGNVRVGDSTAPRTQLDVQGGISSMNTATAPDKSFTFPTLQRIDFTTRRRLTGATTRGTLQGTAQWRGRDENKNLTLPLITATYGDANFTLPTLHQRRFYTRFALTRATRGTLQGSANLRGQDENKNVTLPQITVTRPDVSFTLATLNQRRFTTSLYLTGGTRGTLQGSANLRGQSEGKNIITMAVSPGSLTVASGEFRQYARRQYLQGNARIVLQGSGFLCGMRS